MCICFFGVRVYEGLPFFLSFNRDEEYKRETGRFDHSENHPELIYCLDYLTKGTFLCVNLKNGNICCLLNYSQGYNTTVTLKRGIIPIEFCLTEQDKYVDFFDALSFNADKYNGFNIICGNMYTLDFYYFTNNKNVFEGKHLIKLEENTIYGVSNDHLLNPFDKVKYGIDLFKKIEKNESFEEEALKIMRDKTKFEKREIVSNFNDQNLFSNLPLKQYLRSSIFMDPNLDEEGLIVRAEFGTRQTIIITLDNCRYLKMNYFENVIKADENGKLILDYNNFNTNTFYYQLE